MEILERADHRFGRIALWLARVFGWRCVGVDAAERIVERGNIGGVVGLPVAGGGVEREKIEFVEHAVVLDRAYRLAILM